MGRGIYVGTSKGIKATNNTDYISSDFYWDPSKITHVEVICHFTDVSGWSTVMRKSLFTKFFFWGRWSKQSLVMSQTRICNSSF